MRRVLVAIAALAIGLFAITSSGVRGAGSNAAEEAAIRKIIAAGDANAASGLLALPHLPDVAIWSAAYRQPVIEGEEKPIPREQPQGIANRVPGSQKSKTEPIRIVIAESGDLAYEYSKTILEFDLKNGQHTTLQGGALRVWQKQGGEWKVAAWFTHRYYED